MISKRGSVVSQICGLNSFRGSLVMDTFLFFFVGLDVAARSLLKVASTMDKG